jgi:hypothetical protein
MAFIRTAPGLAHRVINGTAYIVHSKTSMLHELNDTGTFVWNMVKHGASDRDIISRLIKEYDIDEKQAGEDLKDFIAELIKKGLVTRNDA